MFSKLSYWSTPWFSATALLSLNTIFLWEYSSNSHVSLNSTCLDGSWSCTEQNCADICEADMTWNECADCASTCSNMHVSCPDSSCRTQVDFHVFINGVKWILLKQVHTSRRPSKSWRQTRLHCVNGQIMTYAQALSQRSIGLFDYSRHGNSYQTTLQHFEDLINLRSQYLFF